MRYEPRPTGPRPAPATRARVAEESYLLGPGFHPGALLIATVGPAAGATLILLVTLALRIGL
ncbi:hypothetical protein [uncultured Methylobacterium sp.]|jgi:hypothetical protein|uniref:hypothetical protein n=1 Tax=uncultured Methylobacterium sp. TaxID=157278 RepID=UPI00260AE8CA|nr:hypothetical protein [uncultured Methylobacterium sp.]